jgi:hypothetical protein
VLHEVQYPGHGGLGGRGLAAQPGGQRRCGCDQRVTEGCKAGERGGRLGTAESSTSAVQALWAGTVRAHARTRTWHLGAVRP